MPLAKGTSASLVIFADLGETKKDAGESTGVLGYLD
jgi:hypothetical protein